LPERRRWPSWRRPVNHSVSGLGRSSADKFAATQSVRESSGDPRPSIAERYTSKQDYVARVRSAATALREQRLMLPEDVDNWVRRAEAQPAIQSLSPMH
jgi:Alpha/beta hydrolase domain